jgi:hypothetical protein
MKFNGSGRFGEVPTIYYVQDPRKKEMVKIRGAGDAVSNCAGGLDDGSLLKTLGKEIIK